MNKVELTYYTIRCCEEQFGAPVIDGNALVSRATSRFPWLDPLLALSGGQRYTVKRVTWEDACTPDHEPFDNHFHYEVDGLGEHGLLNTTEVVAFFDMAGVPDAFLEVAFQIRRIIGGCSDRRRPRGDQN